MKKLLLSMCFSGCMLASHSQYIKRFHLSVTLRGLEDNTTVCLLRFDTEMKKNDTVGIARSTGDSFYFTGPIQEEGEIYTIRISPGIERKADFSQSSNQHKQDLQLRLFLESGKAEISGNLNDLLTQNPEGKMQINGLPAYRDWISFSRKETDMVNRINTLQEKALQDYSVHQNADSLGNSIQELSRNLLKFKEKWIDSNSSSLIAPYIILFNQADLRWFTNQYKKLSSDARKSKYGKELDKFIAVEKNLQNGSVLPSFSLPATNGDTLHFTNIVNAHKFTLIDFWASWCGPCRGEFKLLKEMYAQFQNKGFGIIAISTDKHEEAWKKALEQDKIPWFNVWATPNTRILSACNITRLPTSFLVDRSGRIIKRDPTMEELTKILKTL